MKDLKRLREGIIGAVLIAAVFWAFSSIPKGNAVVPYPNAGILISAKSLKDQQSDRGFVIIDVRADKNFDGKLIPGAIRLPWSNFQENDVAQKVGEIFIGPDRAQKILGENGVARGDTLVLYDSVERDGGATASYLFWVLDILGHKQMKILDAGIDGWIAQGYETVTEPVKRDPILYQAPAEELQTEKIIDGTYVYNRLGDPFYQIIDVRSRDEYLGNKLSKDFLGNELRAGHVPTAVNVDYKTAWVNEKTKMIKSYSELQEIYRGLDTSKGIILYCNSGRRASFSYFILRLMGINHVISYERSWMEWGSPNRFFPVETIERKLSGSQLPGVASPAGIQRTSNISDMKSSAPEKSRGGYVSCGG